MPPGPPRPTRAATSASRNWPRCRCARSATRARTFPRNIDLYASAGGHYRFLFIAKGGGSSNKTALFQKTKALLNDAALESFVRQQVRALGVAACPPYHLALVVGGTSPEFNLKVLKLATAGALDCLPETADGNEELYRDRRWEGRLLAIAAESGLGAQFGGRYLALDARVVRAARHGGSCPLSLGVSCSAHRNVLGRIGPDGVFLEELDRNAARFLPKALAVLNQRAGRRHARRIELDQPMDEIRRQLGRCPVGTLVLLSGTLVLARALAHARFYELLKSGRPLPEYLSQHVICYAGPAETPPGRVIGSFGPTTAARMDDYLPELMARGASLVTVAKGGRAASVVAACRAGRLLSGRDRRRRGMAGQGARCGVGGDRLRRPGDGGRPPHQGQGAARLRRHRRQGKQRLRSSGVRRTRRLSGKPKCP